MREANVLMIIDYLVNHPTYVTQVAEWCCREWPWYYENGDMVAAQKYHLNTDLIPCALVALEGDKLAGTISIIEEDMDVRPNLSPWLGCLFVAPSFRGQGVASALIDEGASVAKRLGLKKMFAWTESLDRLLARKGWDFRETVDYEGRIASIYRCDPLNMRSPER